jgi:hypothetical protein
MNKHIMTWILRCLLNDLDFATATNFARIVYVFAATISSQAVVILWATGGMMVVKGGRVFSEACENAAEERGVPKFVNKMITFGLPIQCHPIVQECAPC